MKRYLIVAAALALVAVAAALAVRATTGPAEAHVSTLTVDPKGFVLHGGSQVSISGTLACTAGETGFLSVQVSQFAHGQLIVSAFGNAPAFICSGIVQAWRVTALTFTVGLKPGPANVHVDLFTSGFFHFGFDHTSASVKLQRARELPPVSPTASPPASPLAAALSGPVGVATASAAASVLMVGAAVGFLRLLNTGRRREDPPEGR